MAYTTIDDPSAYFQTTLYTGNGGTLAVTNGGNSDLQPNWVWCKVRSSDNHAIFDSVRGGQKQLRSNTADAELTRTNAISSFNSDGFTMGSQPEMNTNGQTYASWNWKAGTSFTNDASSTGIGSIDSAGSFNNDAGFSIVTYTGNGSSGATVKHGMNQKPSMFIIKDRDNSNEGWMVYHTSLGATKYMRLNETGAAATGSAYFNNTEPTSSVFTIGNNDVVNKSGDKYVTYCFAPKQGYSKFSSYVGNGSSSGSYIHLGFKPAFVMTKRTTGSGYDWLLYDNKRQVSFNVVDDFLKPNLADAETTGNANQSLDFLSNGVKFRGNGASSNGSGVVYIYMAFAENPFVTSIGVPATAR